MGAVHRSPDSGGTSREAHLGRRHPVRLLHQRHLCVRLGRGLLRGRQDDGVVRRPVYGLGTVEPPEGVAEMRGE